MKKTKRQKLDDAYIAYQAVKTGQRPRRRTKNGSIPTHPVVPVPDLSESLVLSKCKNWLRARRIFHDRHDAGGGNISGVGYATYGIIGAGDIIGILPGGQHFEIECKAGKGGRLSMGQQERMRGVHEAGGVYLVVHGVEELEHFFKGLI